MKQQIHFGEGVIGGEDSHPKTTWISDIISEDVLQLTAFSCCIEVVTSGTCKNYKNSICAFFSSSLELNIQPNVFTLY